MGSHHEPVRSPFSRPRRLGRVLLGLLLALAFTLLALVASRNFWLNRWIKPRLEHALAARFPGLEIQLGRLEQQFWWNRITGRSLRIRSTNSTWSARFDTVSASGIAWLPLVAGGRHLDSALEHATIQITKPRVELTKSLYAISADQIWASLSARELVVNALRIEPFVSDTDFFAARDYRRARLRFAFSKCRLSGIDTEELITGRAFRADLLDLQDGSLESLISRDKPRNPKLRPVWMPNDGLARLAKPVELKEARVHGRIVAEQRDAPGREPGVMTFEGLEIIGRHIQNEGAAGATMDLAGHTEFMGTSTLQATLTIPVAPSDSSFKYSGSLARMDLVKLNPFLTNALHSRVDSGVLYELNFDCAVQSGHVRGTIRAAYENLSLTLLNRETGSDEGLLTRIKTFVTDHMILQTSNLPTDSGSMKVGRIDYTREPNEKFLRLLWSGLRNGLVDLLGIENFVKKPK